VVQALFALIRFRNTHPAFEGEFHLLSGEDHMIQMEWRKDRDWAHLEVDLERTSALIRYSSDAGDGRLVVAGAAQEATPR
jgi:sucrose phosphorylase